LWTLRPGGIASAALALTQKKTGRASDRWTMRMACPSQRQGRRNERVRGYEIGCRIKQGGNRICSGAALSVRPGGQKITRPFAFLLFRKQILRLQYAIYLLLSGYCCVVAIVLINANNADYVVESKS
jgi:hypothetical protein